jgi:hypothetical protein
MRTSRCMRLRRKARRSSVSRFSDPLWQSLTTHARVLAAFNTVLMSSVIASVIDGMISAFHDRRSLIGNSGGVARDDALWPSPKAGRVGLPPPHHIIPQHPNFRSTTTLSSPSVPRRIPAGTLQKPQDHRAAAIPKGCIAQRLQSLASAHPRSL